MNKDLIIAAFAVSIISLVAGALLTIVDKMTEPARRAIEKMTLEEGLREVLPENVETVQDYPANDKKLEELTADEKFFSYTTEDGRSHKLLVWSAYKKQSKAAEDTGTAPRVPVARAYLAGIQGYGGKVIILLGVEYIQDKNYKTNKFELKSKIRNYVVQEMSQETPGLGTKIADESFVAQWRGLTLGKELNLSMSGGKVDAITGATISSNAINKAVRVAMQLDKVLRDADMKKFHAPVMAYDKSFQENEAMRIKAADIAMKKKAEEDRKLLDLEKARIAKEKEAEAKKNADANAKKKAEDDARIKVEREKERLKIQAEAEKIAAEIVAKAIEEANTALKEAKLATEKMNSALAEKKKISDKNAELLKKLDASEKTVKELQEKLDKLSSIEENK